MIRNTFSKTAGRGVDADPGQILIRRIEAFSDAVFAFALTLLVVSLEVPRSFEDLTRSMKGFPAFAVCFAVLVMIWYFHCEFFRQYPLTDLKTIVLNALLLFVVLFYVYPLKFLFQVLFAMPLGLSGPDQPTIQPSQMPSLLITYGVGFLAIFAIFALLTRHALQQRDELGLSEEEILEARSALRAHLMTCIVPLASITVALAGGPVVSAIGLPANLRWLPDAIAGLLYWFLFPMHHFHQRFSRRERDRFLEGPGVQPDEAEEDTAPPAPQVPD